MFTRPLYLRQHSSLIVRLLVPMWGWLWDILTFLGLFKKNAAIVLLVRIGLDERFLAKSQRDGLMLAPLGIG